MEAACLNNMTDLDILKKQWVQSRDPETQIHMWNQSAPNYEKKEIPSLSEDDFLHLIAQQVNLNRKMKCLDIGCGAGIYSLALAPYVHSVLGVDISPEMIAACNRKAAAAGYENASFSCVDWDTLDLKKDGFYHGFDLVFARMTPAICDYDSFEKMVNCSRRYGFLESNIKRQDAGMDHALSLIHIRSDEKPQDEKLNNCRHYLELHGIRSQVFYRQEIWKPIRTVENAISWCLDRAKLSRPITDEDRTIIRNHFTSIAEDGMIRDTVHTTVATLFWEMQ